jgi:hypothetical protein
MTDPIQNDTGSFKRNILPLMLMLMVALAGFASVAGATYSLPASRSVQWQGNVGVLGDIPSRTTIYKTLSPSGGNDATAIQSAISACPSGQVVKLSAGTFSVGSPITVKSGVTLRGAGMGTTIIKGASGMSGAFVMGFSAGSYLGTSLNITGGFSKGSSTITTGAAHGWSVGDIVLIDQLNNAGGDPVVTNVGTNGACTWCGRSSGTRSLGQVSKVIAVPSSTTATLEMPLYWNYASSLSPQATKMSGLVSNAGIEDLTVDNSLSGSSAQSSDGTTIALYGSTNCWLLRVEGVGSYTNMVRVKNSYRNTVRSCKLHEGVPALPVTGSQYSTSRAYGVVMDFSSANLFENNQIYHLTMGIAMRGPTSGNVVGYNIINDMYFSDSANWQTDSFDFHGGHAMMNLFESNYIVKGRMCADYVWGSSSHNSFFRNKNTIDTSRPLAAWDYSLYKYSTYYNFIGNVIGTPGFETTYIMQGTNTNTKAIFGFDALPLATVFLHANWDTINNGVSWSGTADRILPASLYLSAKPSWWGNTAWPAIGPDVSPMYPAAPSTGGGTPWGTSKPALAPPTSLAVH